MATLTWTSLGTLTTILSTELNALASAARSISAAIANATATDRWMDLELNVTFGVAPSAGGYVGVYIVPSLDGTNYSDGDASIVPPATMFVGSFPVRAVTTAQKVHIKQVPLQPLNFKVVVDNQSGQAFPATGSTVKYRTYNEEIV